jgi:hypothetical protein
MALEMTPMDTDSTILSLDELRTLREDNPQGLFRHLAEVQRGFLFGVEDHREDEARWGGEVRVVINRNVELHFVPGFDDEMPTRAELPQFSVLPDEDRADTVEDTTLVLDDGDEVKGAIFWVDPTEYDVLVGAATRALERYEDWDLIPDTYFLDSPLVQFVDRVVLEHSAVRLEREYDFRRGLVGGPPPSDELEDEPPPVIGEEDDDEGYTLHPALLGGDDEEGDELGLLGAEREVGDDEDEDDLDAADEGDEGDDGQGPRRHFRSVRF